MKLLLDTCTFLWIMLDAPELSKDARGLFSDPTNEVFLSAVSAWEISVKYSLGKLPLPQAPEVFIPQNRSADRITSLPLTEADVVQIPGIPTLHKDPFDRMLVCQALAEGLTLLTPDPAIKAYPVATIW